MIELLDGQGRAESSHDFTVLRHQDGFAGHFFKGGDDAPVGRGGALVKDGVAHPPLFFDFIEVILDDGVGQASHQVLFGRALLLVVDQV